MYESQVLVDRGCPILRIQTVDFVQLVGPIVTRVVEGPTAHMSEALSFAEIKLTPLQSFFCALLFSDILDGTKQFARPLRLLSVRINWRRAPKLRGNGLHCADFRRR